MTDKTELKRGSWRDVISMEEAERKIGGTDEDGKGIKESEVGKRDL